MFLSYGPLINTHTRAPLSPPLPNRLVAFRPCPAGRQVFLSYGPLPNAKLLLFYGFAMEGNPFDTVALPAEV